MRLDAVQHELADFKKANAKEMAELRESHDKQLAVIKVGSMSFFNVALGG
jgi:hypothetical protein